MDAVRRLFSTALPVLLLCGSAVVTVAAERASPPPGALEAVPAQPPQPIEEMVEFGIEEEGLTVRTSLRPTNGQILVEATNLPGTIRADVTLRFRRDRPGGALFFKLGAVL